VKTTFTHTNRNLEAPSDIWQKQSKILHAEQSVSYRQDRAKARPKNKLFTAVNNRFLLTYLLPY